MEDKKEDALNKILNNYRISVVIFWLLVVVVFFSYIATIVGLALTGCAGCINLTCKGATIDASTCNGCSWNEVSLYVIVGIIGLVISLVCSCILLKLSKDINHNKKLLLESNVDYIIKKLKLFDKIIFIIKITIIIAITVPAIKPMIEFIYLYYFGKYMQL